MVAAVWARFARAAVTRLVAFFTFIVRTNKPENGSRMRSTANAMMNNPA